MRSAALHNLSFTLAEQGLQLCDRMVEGPGAGDLLPFGWDVFQGEGVSSIQLATVLARTMFQWRWMATGLALARSRAVRSRLGAVVRSARGRRPRLRPPPWSAAGRRLVLIQAQVNDKPAGIRAGSRRVFSLHFGRRGRPAWRGSWWGRCQCMSVGRPTVGCLRGSCGRAG